jgi:hypothetical protein
MSQSTVTNCEENASAPTVVGAPPELALLTSVLKVMLALAGLLIFTSLLFFTAHAQGLVTGAVVGVLLYLIAWYAGLLAVLSRKFALAMVLLFGLQLLVWLFSALLIGRLGVDGGAFALGAGVLPIAIIATVLGRAWRHRGVCV